MSERNFRNKVCLKKALHWRAGPFGCEVSTASLIVSLPSVPSLQSLHNFPPDFLSSAVRVGIYHEVTITDAFLVIKP